MELNNEVVEVFSGSTLSPVTIAPLESLFGTPEIFGAAGDGSYSVQGDPRCYFDATTGHWYASQIWLDLNNATPPGLGRDVACGQQNSRPDGFVERLLHPRSVQSDGNRDVQQSANQQFDGEPVLR